MSAFDNLAAAAATEEAKAKSLAARAWARLPVRAPARVEVAVEAHRSALGTGLKCLAVLGLLYGAYRLGGAEGREAYASEHAAFESYKAADAKALADAKQHDIDVTTQIAAAVKKNQDAADLKAGYLQTRIDSYVADLAHRPADARCVLSPDDLRRLRDDAGPRPRRRPARPSADAE